MKKIFLLVACLVSIFMFSQIGTSFPSLRIGGENSKWTFGGYAGLGGVFGGNGGTSLYVSPRAGYKLAENFEVGAAGNFTWYSLKNYSSTMLGVGPFANYYIGRSFYLSAMFQEYFINRKANDYKFSSNEEALYLGAGYMRQLGEHIYMQVGGMYNVLYNRNKSALGGGFIPNVGIVYGL